MTALLLIFFGLGILAVAFRAHGQGEIPAGTAGLKGYRPTRTESPTAFYFFLTVYTGGGLALLMWGILTLVGVAEPLPVH